jgi:hypothetical protein
VVVAEEGSAHFTHESVIRKAERGNFRRRTRRKKQSRDFEIARSDDIT